MADEPTIAFVITTQQWISVVHPVTKLELLDWIATAQTNFFYDIENNAFVLLLKQTLWNNLESPVKYRFKLISRRLREEMDGPFNEDQRRQLEAKDPFDVFRHQLPETIPEETNEDIINLLNECDIQS